MEENYAWMGQHWPDSRYVVISLSFDMQGEEKPAPWIEGWHCVYDLKTGAFSVPPDFAENNAKAVKTPPSIGMTDRGVKPTLDRSSTGATGRLYRWRKLVVFGH